MIDYIAQLKLTQILQNDNINVIVEEMWKGNVDNRQTSDGLANSVRKSSLGFAYARHFLFFDKFLSMVSLDYPLNCLYYWVLFGYELTVELFSQKKDIAKRLFKTRYIQHSMSFGYNTYTRGFRDQYLINGLFLLIILVLYIVYASILVYNQDKLYEINDKIQTLIAAGGPAQDIEDQYNNMSINGDRWWYAFKALIWINLFLSNYLCYDILVLISFKLRNIPTRALSSTFKPSFALNLIAAILAITSFIKCYSEYADPGSVSRPEEKYFRAMVETRDGSYDINAITGFFILYIMIRVMLQLMYNSVFGTLIQLMFKMVKDSIAFLIVFFMLIV